MNATSSSQSLDENILFALDNLKIGSAKRRIVNELVEFIKKGAYIDATYNEDNKNNVNSIITINIMFQYNHFSFDITNRYPFIPPKNFRCNYINYKNLLRISSPKTLEELKKYKGINCLCCHTIACGDNWGPSIRMIDFINEYNKIKQYRRDIINRVLVEKIISKYLISDINLCEWLF